MRATPTAKDPTTTRSLDQLIQERAYELYQQRGEQNGRDFDDWLQAEDEILDALASRESFLPDDPHAY